MAINRLLSGAAQAKLEGRIVPIQRSRAPGFSQLMGLNEKVQRWAEVTQVESAGILACFALLQAFSPAEIADRLMAANGPSVADSLRRPGGGVHASDTSCCADAA